MKSTIAKESRLKNQPQPIYNKEYSKEISCYLPANSEIPQATQREIAPAALSALVEVIQASTQLQQQIEGRLVPMFWLSDGFARLGALTAHAHHLFAEEVAVSRALVEIKWPAGQEGVPEEALIERVFNITRLAPMSWLQWATQLAESCTYLVSDLSFAVLNIDEMAAILVAIKSIFTRLAQDLAIQPAAPPHPLSRQPWGGLRGGGDPLESQAVLTFWGLHQDRTQRWQTFPDRAADAQRVEAWQAWEKQVVFYRSFSQHG